MIIDHTDSCMNVLFMLWKAIDHVWKLLIIAMNRHWSCMITYIFMSSWTLSWPLVWPKKVIILIINHHHFNSHHHHHHFNSHHQSSSRNSSVWRKWSQWRQIRNQSWTPGRCPPPQQKLSYRHRLHHLNHYRQNLDNPYHIPSNIWRSIRNSDSVCPRVCPRFSAKAFKPVYTEVRRPPISSKGLPTLFVPNMHYWSPAALGRKDLSNNQFHHYNHHHHHLGVDQYWKSGEEAWILHGRTSLPTCERSIIPKQMDCIVINISSIRIIIIIRIVVLFIVGDIIVNVS